MTQTFVSWKTITLKAKLNPSDTSLTADIDIWVTAWRFYFVNNSVVEWLDFSGVSASGSNFTYSNLVRGLSQTADPATAWTGQTWLAWNKWVLVAMHDQLVDKNQPTQIHQEALTYATTAARDSALWADWAGTIAYTDVYVTATGFFYNYNLSTWQWETQDTWTPTPNASETVAWSIEIATDAEITAWTLNWATWAILWITPVQLKKSISLKNSITSFSNTDEIIVNESWEDKKISILNARSSLWIKFGWDWSDWAISWALTITWSDNTYIVKNYTTFAPWANIVTTTPTWCITHIKVSWDCDLTWTTFNYSWKWIIWTNGWSGWWLNPWTAWSSWTATTNPITITTLHKALSWTSWTGWQPFSATFWTGWANTWLINNIITPGFFQACKQIVVIPWGAWWAWWWGGSSTSWWAWWAGWSGWGWGWAVILEVAWNLTFSWSTIDCSWANWWNWVAGSTASSQSWWGGWAWWGWWGWMFTCFYNWTLSWSVTPNIAWWSAWTIWAWWTWWTSWSWAWGWGWSGWAWGWWNSWWAWWNWWAGNSSNWWNWWTATAWWIWLYLIEKNHIFS